MKKLAIILSLFLCTTAWAQWHIEVGVGVSQINSPYPETGAGIGGFAGAGYRISLVDKLGLDPMIQISWQGKESYGALYAKLPILVSYRIARFELGAGPYASYGLWDHKNPERYYDAPASGTDYNPWARSAFGYFKRFDMGISARICYHLERAFIGLEGSYGLLDIAQKNMSKPFNAHTMGVSLIAGFNF